MTDQFFSKAQWIWRAEQASRDEFCDFKSAFYVADGPEGGAYTLTIASDSNYTVWLNGRLAAWGQYADYPDYKVCDRVDVTEFVQAGENRVAITVWYYGMDNCSAYHPGEAGLIYEITDGTEVLDCSGTHTLSRLSRGHLSGQRASISVQLGYTFHYDAKADDGFALTANGAGFAESRLVLGISTDFHLRPNKKLVLKERCPTTYVQMGVFKYIAPIEQPHANMQRAALSHRFPRDLIGSSDVVHPATTRFAIKDGEDAAWDGLYFIVDLGSETAGFLDLDIEVPEDCRIDIGFGEHLADGRIRTGQCGFYCDVLAKAGRNTYLHTFRRLGCRYLQFFVHAREATVHYAGLRPTVYPLKFKEYKSGNLLRDTIYKVCQDTLLHCLHEHYEDCPWREQCLYIMDARNQMLCGYYAFDEYEAPRASLELIAHGLRPEGLLSLCFPAGFDLPIPFFSCMYFVAMNEYVQYSGDTSLIEQYDGVLETVMNTFLSKMQPSGVIDHFYGAKLYDQFYGFWNFYEWQPTMNGYDEGNRERSRLAAPLNAFLCLALRAYAEISDTLGKPERAEDCRARAVSIARAIGEVFYNPDTKLFETYDCISRGEYSVLTQALCVLCGAGEGKDLSRILPIVASNGKENFGLTVYPATLSMYCFRFDALLAVDREKYAPVILREIDEDYFYMLRQGATTFWERIIGAATVYDEVPSLCHGWSALPIYYYELLNK